MHSLRQRINARDESGFTLIELLVVLIIIGVLLAIAVPSYLGFKDKSQKTAAAADVREGEPSAEAYYSDNNTYAGMTTTNMKAIDSGLSTALLAPASLTATTYCLEAVVGGFHFHDSGPGGTVTNGACP